VIKHNFDQTPKLLETFDQLIRSSEIRSTDPLSLKLIQRDKKVWGVKLTKKRPLFIHHSLRNKD
jgi:hypothetical protein